MFVKTPPSPAHVSFGCGSHLPLKKGEENLFFLEYFLSYTAGYFAGTHGVEVNARNIGLH